MGVTFCLLLRSHFPPGFTLSAPADSPVLGGGQSPPSITDSASTQVQSRNKGLKNSFSRKWGDCVVPSFWGCLRAMSAPPIVADIWALKLNTSGLHSPWLISCVSFNSSSEREPVFLYWNITRKGKYSAFVWRPFQHLVCSGNQISVQWWLHWHSGQRHFIWSCISRCLFEKSLSKSRRGIMDTDRKYWQFILYVHDRLIMFFFRHSVFST